MKSMYLVMFLCVSLVNAQTNEDDAGDEELHKVVDEETSDEDVGDEGTAFEESALDLRNGAGCSPRTSCQDAEGTCKQTCDEATEKEVADGCHGDGCKCCVNTSLRQAVSCARRFCHVYNGNCKPNPCGKNSVELRIPSFFCFDSSCHCCIPMSKLPSGLGVK